MRLVVQIKLLPTEEQATALLQTLKITNNACNRLSELAWNVKQFRRFPLQNLFYYQLRREFPLSAQMVCNVAGKVCEAYGRQKKKIQPKFRELGSVVFDRNLLSFNIAASTLNIWTINGRTRMSFTCANKHRSLLDRRCWESDLVVRNGKWFLHILVEIQEPPSIIARDVLGVDLGIVELAYDSDGNKYSGGALNRVRTRNLAIRKKLQKKGTKSAKRLLKKRRKKESRFATDTNHCISKRIVQTAERTNRAIAIEDLTGIRSRARARKRQKTQLHSWAFSELSRFITYKAKRCGIPLILIDPTNTSKRCSECGHIEKANRKSQAEFCCKQCGYADNADRNGAKNIRAKGLGVFCTGAFNHPNAEADSHGQIYDRSHLQAGIAVCS